MISSHGDGLLVIMFQYGIFCVCINIFGVDSALLTNGLEICNCKWVPKDKGCGIMISDLKSKYFVFGYPLTVTYL